MAATGYTPSILFNSVTTGNTPSSLVQGETAWNITDKKLWVGNASGTPIQLIGAGASMTLATLTTANDASISGLTVGKGGGAIASNTALGYNSLSSGSQSGTQNFAAGWQVLTGNTTGSNNVGSGAQTLFSNTTGSSNTGTGTNALPNNTTGSFNSAFGQQALNANTTASNNTAVGYQAGYSNTTGAITAFGYQAGYSNTTAVGNAAFGVAALSSTTTGAYNTAIGSGVAGVANGALTNNTTGSYNTALGSNALGSNTTASNNTAVGYQAGYSNTTGASLTMLGYQAGYSNTVNGNITAIGYQAGYACTSGASTFLGYLAGSTFTGSYGIFIGNNSQPSVVSDTYEIVIGCNGTIGKGSSTGFINANGGGTYQGNNSTLWSITSDQRLKKNIVDNKTGLDKITQIQVRNFEYRTEDEVTELPKESAIKVKGVQLGLIAQELAQVLPDCVKTESTGVMSVDASNITWYLVNAIKELKAKLEAQALEIATLKGQ